MQLTIAGSEPPSAIAELIAIVAFEGDIANDLVTSYPSLQAVSDLISVAITEQRFKATAGQVLSMETLGRLPNRRLLLVGAGKRSGFSFADYRHPAAQICKTSNTLGIRSLLVLDDARLTPDERVARVGAIAQGLLLGEYRFEKYLSPQKRNPSSLELAILEAPSGLGAEAAIAVLGRARRVAAAVSHARDLVNEPAGALTPTTLAEAIAARAEAVGVDAKVFGPDECRSRGMGMFLAVAQGSQQPPRFIHLAWRPPLPKRRVVIVGKGVTFDSGGLSLKTNEGMLDMKSDMAGAAAVLTAILVAAEEKLPVEVHALAACTENMPSGTAYKLGDVLRSMSGKTVEINNTDAEGRLTLGDALTYGLELKPDVILDFATLTGACVVALGPHTAGVMTNNEAARSEWLDATRTAGEDMWPLPLPARLTEQLKSEIADMRNTGERWGGALTAGLFLKEFVGEYPWIHVDIAGPATSSKEWGAFGKGATGFGVASIVEYLRGIAGKVPPSPPFATPAS